MADITDIKTILYTEKKFEFARARCRSYSNFAKND